MQNITTLWAKSLQRTLQRTATHTATYCNTHFNTLQHSPQHTATHCVSWAKSAHNANNATHYVKLGKKRWKSFKHNCYTIFQRVMIKAIIIKNQESWAKSQRGLLRYPRYQNWNTLRHTASHYKAPWPYTTIPHYRFNKTKQHTHCNTLQHTATYCNTLQPTATHCNTLQHTATHCNLLQHTATHCNTLHHTATHTATHCSKVRILRYARYWRVADLLVSRVSQKCSCLECSLNQIFSAKELYLSAKEP